MNLDELRVEVFRQTGLSIDKDDPFFAAMVMLSIIAEDIKAKSETALGYMEGMVNETARRDAGTLSRSEKLLAEAAGKIRSAADQVTGAKQGVLAAAVGAVNELVAPVMTDVEAVLTTLQEKDRAALDVLKRTVSTQATWAANATLTIWGAVVLCVLAAGGGYYVGQTTAQHKIEQRTAWLDSDDGKYALQLRDAGSLKALATCNAGDYKNNWQKKPDGKACIPNPTDGTIIGWRISR